MMFIRPIGGNPLQDRTQYEYIPDLIFNMEEEAIDYLAKESFVKFLKPTYFGLSEGEEVGFLTQKKIQIKDKQFNSNTIFVLNKDSKKIKETHGALFVKIIENNANEHNLKDGVLRRREIKEKISKIRKQNLDTTKPDKGLSL